MKKVSERAKLWLFLVVSVIAIFLAAAMFAGCNKNPEKSAEVVEIDSLEQEVIPTVQEVLQRRNDMLHLYYVDSVYMYMPEPILINILVNKGTLLSQDEIVAEYMTQYEYYSNLIKQVTIQNQYIPDSLPRQSYPEQHRSDSIAEIKK